MRALWLSNRGGPAPYPPFHLDRRPAPGRLREVSPPLYRARPAACLQDRRPDPDRGGGRQGFPLIVPAEQGGGIDEEKILSLHDVLK
jgi:hypothetical protein